MTTTDEFLAHYGVKGMKWGTRRGRVEGVSARTNREASRDAKEFARAKMFYGEGAGNRRKLIKATVEGKSKKDPSYKKAFDHHLENQDLSSHASRARGERKRKNAVNSTAKTARGVKNVIMQNGAPVTVAAAIIGGAASSPKVRAFAASAGKTAYSAAATVVRDAKFKATLRSVGL